MKINLAALYKAMIDAVRFVIVYLIAFAAVIAFLALVMALDPTFVYFPLERQTVGSLAQMTVGDPIIVDPSAILKYQPIVTVIALLFGTAPFSYTAYWMLMRRKPESSPEPEDGDYHQWSRQTIEISVEQ